MLVIQEDSFFLENNTLQLYDPYRGDGLGAKGYLGLIGWCCFKNVVSCFFGVLK